MMKIRSFAALMGIVAFAACDKNAVQDITGVVPEAKVRFFNFALGAPSVNFFANDAKVTAVLSAVGTESPAGVAYGAVGAGGLYTGVTPGSYQLASKISDTTIKNVTVAKATQTIVAGKAYSFFMSGPYDAATRTSDSFVVEDPYPDTFDYTKAYVRFVNAIYNSTPLTLYGVNTSIPGSTETAIGGAVAYKAAGAFVALPCGSYDLNARLTGSAVNTIPRAAVSFVCGRVYTIGARGDITILSTSTAATRPALDNTANR